MTETQENPAGLLSHRLTCSIDEATAATGLCPATLYNRMNAGKLRTTKDGGRRLIIVSSLLSMLQIDRDGNPIDGAARARKKATV